MKKINTKILIIWILFVVFFVLNFSFAENLLSEVDSSNFNISSILQSINDLLKGIWIWLVILAWKLYTNDLLYWTSLHLDTILWNIWQFSRTFANFIIWFILIVSIFLMFFWKVKNIFSIIWKIGIASILVNLSWWIIAVIIDISNVLLLAIWSFPISLMWDLQYSNNIEYCEKPQIWYKISDNPNNPTERFYSCEETQTINAADFLQKMNNMSWPLFYIWASILHVDKNLNVDKDIVNDWHNALKVISISFLLQFIIVVLFVVPIILLIIIWVLRIFWIWIYVAFSPLIFLDQVFWWKVWTKHKAFVFKNVIWLIFQPVLVVFALWISLIFIVSLQNAFLIGSNNLQAKKVLWVCENSNNSLCMDDNKIVTIEWNFINTIIENSWWVFGYIILTILSIIFLWSIIKLSFKSTEITASISDSVYKFSEDLIKQVPIIPTPFGWVWIWATGKMFEKMNITIWLKSKADKKSDELTEKIYYALWIKQIDLRSSEENKWLEELRWKISYKDIYALMKKFINYTKEKYPDLIPMDSPIFKKIIGTYINKIWEKHKDIYKTLWLQDNDKKNITQPLEMFKTQEFPKFVTWLIKYNYLLDKDTPPSDLFQQINNYGQSDELSTPIKHIQ